MQKRFTLIELLVVISIIGILASILMPSLSKAREKARMAVCVNNLNQISLSSFVYSDGSDESLPVWRTNTNHGYWGKDMVGLERALRPITGGEEPNGTNPVGLDMYMCPSAPVSYNQEDHKYIWEGSTHGTINTYEGLYYHYGRTSVNGVLDSPGDALLRRGTYAAPSQHPYQFCSRRLNPAWAELDDSGWNNTLVGASWHKRGDNGPRPTVFLDGHVKILKSMVYTKHQNQAILQSGSTIGKYLVNHKIEEY